MSTNFTLMALTVLGSSVVGTIFANWAILRLQRLAQQDSSKLLAKQLPKPNLMGGKVYERGQSYKFFGIILNSTRWPKNPSLYRKLQQIRIVAIIGIIFYLLAIVAILIVVLAPLF